MQRPAAAYGHRSPISLKARCTPMLAPAPGAAAQETPVTIYCLLPDEIATLGIFRALSINEWLQTGEDVGHAQCFCGQVKCDERMPFHPEYS